MEKRLIELESRLAFQEITIEELNDVLVRQQEQLDLVLAELRLLKEQMQGLTPPDGDAKKEPPPPHY